MLFCLICLKSAKINIPSFKLDNCITFYGCLPRCQDQQFKRDQCFNKLYFAENDELNNGTFVS